MKFMKRSLFSIVIIAVAAIAITGIWWPELFACVLEFLNWARPALLTFIVVAICGLLLLCCRDPKTVVQTMDASDTGDPEKLDPPYPENGWKALSGFRYESDLKLLRLKSGLRGIPNINREAQYIVAWDYIVSFCIDGKRYSIEVPRGMLTDLASVPRPFRSLVGRVGPHLEAAVVHDYLYVAWFQAGFTPNREMRRFADELMLLAMYSTGMRCKARLIFRAVRLFGGQAFKSTKQTPVVLEDDQFPGCCRDRNHPELPPRSEDAEEQASNT